jgi:hypothetical protein
MLRQLRQRVTRRRLVQLALHTLRDQKPGSVNAPGLLKSTVNKLRR